MTPLMIIALLGGLAIRRIFSRATQSQLGWIGAEARTSRSNK